VLNPPLCGLVLSGGHSLRMGVDKGALVYPGSGADQRTQCAGLLAAHCAEVFVSCRAEQVRLLGPGLRPIVDHPALGDLGPSAGLLSAYRHAPGAGWLVLAVDFPCAGPEALAALVQRRDPAALGTAFVNDAGLLEPLFSVWEPAGLGALERFPGGGPRRVLEAGPCVRLRPADARWLLNVNTPEQFSAARGS
jgi:molybdopterin-guanine dinucleotide biosynthesis protein A